MAFATLSCLGAQFFFGLLDLFFCVVVDVLPMRDQMTKGCVDFAFFDVTTVLWIRFSGLLCRSRLVLIVGIFDSQVFLSEMVIEFVFFAASNRTFGAFVLLKPKK
jgi:hypothetical protein